MLWVAALALSMLASGIANADDGVGPWDREYVGDNDFDCDIDPLDAQRVAYRYGTFWPHAEYSTLFDNEPFYYSGIRDLDVDIKDLQFEFGRNGFDCWGFWEPETASNGYSHTGGDTTCTGGSPAWKDPISVVFFGNATPQRLKNDASAHGFPTSDASGDQRFWEIGRCTFEDVDRAQNGGGALGFYDARWHFRAEYVESSRATNFPPSTSRFPTSHYYWGRHSVATPHFDEDDDFCGHFVPDPFDPSEHPEIGPFVGSGFEAGRERVYQQYVLSGGHGHDYLFDVQQWDNRARILQNCGGRDEYPGLLDGYVYFIYVS